MKALNTIETTLDIYFNSPSENGKGAGLGQEDERYITSSGDKFYIERDFYGKLVPFGFYDSMEDAIAARNILDSNGWDVSKVV